MRAEIGYKINAALSEIAKIEETLQAIRGNRDRLSIKYRQQAKEKISELKMYIWKLQNPAQFENHKRALQRFFASGGFGTL